MGAFTLIVNRKEATTTLDYVLIKRILKGDQQAFEQLVRKYYHQIYRYCYRKTSDRVVASDLTQDVFLKLIQAIYQFRFTGKFSNFLFTIAVNTCADYLRKKTIAPGFHDEVEELPGKDRQPLDEIVRSEEFSTLWDLIYKLPDSQQDALILYYYHDLKAKDVAQIMGTSVSTTKSRIKQGLDKLKKKYREDTAYEKEE